MADTQVAPRLLVLPEVSTDDARIVTLAHPRSSKPCRFYSAPPHGLYELTKVAAPKLHHRSWLLKSQPRRHLKRKRGDNEAVPVDDKATTGTGDSDTPCITGRQDEEATSNDYVIKNTELFMATPIDPVFLLLPSFNNQKLFLPVDDLLDKLLEQSPHFSKIIYHESMRKHIEARLESVCDIVDAGGEQMYRLSEEKLLGELVLKARKIVASALPSSMEERFIRRPLETPLIGSQSESSSRPAIENVTPASEITAAESVESQSSVTTMESISSTTSVETEVTVPTDLSSNESPDTHHLLRMRTALSFMISSYIPASLADAVLAKLATEESPIDFKPLDFRLAEIAKLRAEALAARSLGDFSQKRNLHEEDDAAESRLEKKRRREEEEKKKKAGETRGIRDLKKVDTKGMKKMSDFFGKRTSPRKKK